MALIAVLLVPLGLVLAVAFIARRLIARHDTSLPRGAMPKGARVARLILDRRGVRNVEIEPGDVDAYAPIGRRIELARERFSRRSTSAAAIAAHEA